MSPPSVSRQHADWLSLVEVSGPFVSLPVLMRAFPQGLDARDPVQAKGLREAFEDWHNNPAAAGKHRAWLLHVLIALLGYPDNLVVEGQALPAGLEARMPELGETLRPDLALVGPAGTDSAGQAQLLIATYPAEQALGKPVSGRHWKATPATRMMELLHGAGVPVGLVTNGEQWMLVYAPRGEVTGYASWYASLWLDEPITLRAFHSLLGVRRFFGVAADGTLQALLKESASDQQEVTDQLGYQVREAVEVLVQSFDALDKESNRTLLKGVSPAAQYDAALTVMMRLVFLFSAEERGLLHLGKPLYDENYAVSTLQEQLQEVADKHGEEVLERRSDAWARLLASFRAVHGGIRHQDLLMQAYGGSLFDPDRYAFLEGRPAGSQWSNTVADPLTVNNRVVLHLLNSLQRLRIKGGASGATETRRVSFRALGVEQIGHVYEGLLDHTAVRTTEPVLGLKGTRSKEPEIALAKLELLLAQGQDKLVDFLKEETGRSVLAIRRALDEGGLMDAHRLLLACNQDESLQTRLRPFAGLIRSDSFEQPLVVLTGSVFVTAGSTRRSTGAHYTPPSLTEPIVRHTLEPLVYVGPAEGLPRDEWKLKSPKAILSLKVCDMAMGSGAFLVQVCRYLAERLTEAWENEENRHPGEVLITPDGEFSTGSPSERLVPADVNERIAIARRVVADRCLYGVDINPMAVEMAKLSLWLITVDAHRPFTFLDHALKCGDSLLGITTLEQLENFSMRPGGGKQQAFSTLNLRQHIDDAMRKRELLEAMPSDTPEQVSAKAALYAEAEDAVAKLHALADSLVAVELKGLKNKAYDAEREASADQMTVSWERGILDLQNIARQRLGRHTCLHWVLTFPEVVGKGGFSAFIGNPPFMGGRKISSSYGDDYEVCIKNIVLDGAVGTVNFVIYFMVRGAALLSPAGVFGFIATDTVRESESCSVGMRLLLSRTELFRATPSIEWPGEAAVSISVIHGVLGAWSGTKWLMEAPVEFISEQLKELNTGRSLPPPSRLKVNQASCSDGVKVQGIGFVISNEEKQELVNASIRNEEVITRYIVGDDINRRWDQLGDRWVINYWNRSEDDSMQYIEPWKILIERVKPYRDGLTRQVHESCFWKFWDRREAFFNRIQQRQRMLVASKLSKHFCVEFGYPEFIYSEKAKVFDFSSTTAFSVLQSEFHIAWALQWGSSMGGGLAYTGSGCFDTFPFPPTFLVANDAVLQHDAKEPRCERAGDELWKHRKGILAAKRIGLTSLYNLFHDKGIVDPEVIELRRLHVLMDQAVAAAYGWQDLDLGHDFHETKLGGRYTISDEARHEVLARLLTLNHQRHAGEESGGAVPNAAAIVKRGRKPKVSSGQTTFDM